jgi:hypothetical protein
LLLCMVCLKSLRRPPPFLDCRWAREAPQGPAREPNSDRGLRRRSACHDRAERRPGAPCIASFEDPPRSKVFERTGVLVAELASPVTWLAAVGPRVCITPPRLRSSARQKCRRHRRRRGGRGRRPRPTIGALPARGSPPFCPLLPPTAPYCPLLPFTALYCPLPPFAALPLRTPTHRVQREGLALCSGRFAMRHPSGLACRGLRCKLEVASTANAFCWKTHT